MEYELACAVQPPHSTERSRKCAKNRFSNRLTEWVIRFAFIIIYHRIIGNWTFDWLAHWLIVWLVFSKTNWMHFKTLLTKWRLAHYNQITSIISFISWNIYIYIIRFSSNGTHNNQLQLGNKMNCINISESIQINMKVNFWKSANRLHNMNLNWVGFVLASTIIIKMNSYVYCRDIGYSLK